MKQLLLLLLLPLLLLAVAGAYFFLRSPQEDPLAEHRVELGSVARHAVAVGRIEPTFEIPVTTTNSGQVTRRFVELGQRVRAGDPLVEVRPVLTDVQRLRAERSLLAAHEAEAGAVELAEGENLAGWTMRMLQGRNSMERLRAGAQRARSSAEESLTLLLEGEVEVEGLTLDWIVRAPMDGHVLELGVELGEPVVPASQYGAGTVLCVMGDLDTLVFRGTAGEIDVGQLAIGMPVSVTVGALPDLELSGVLREISLRGQSQNNAVQFPVVADVELKGELTLRSGYSAVAHIELERVGDVVVLPERLVRFTGGGARVLRPGADGPSEQPVEAGLSDGLVVAVRSGLNVGDVVLEWPR